MSNLKTNRLITRNFYPSIPRPRVTSRANEQVPNISLLPLLPSDIHVRLAILVSPAVTRLQHISFPLHSPRASPFIPLTASPPDNESKEERDARVQLYASELLSLQAQHGPDNSSTQPRVLWSVAGRYVRKGNGGGLTLLHANGLRKEVNIHLYLICGGFAVPHTKLFETFGSTLRYLLQVTD